MNLKKCYFFKTKVDYLRYVSIPAKLEIATDGTKSVCEASFPATKTQLKSFLGEAEVYRRFIPIFARITRPLTAMLKDYAHPCWEEPEKK